MTSRPCITCGILKKPDKYFNRLAKQCNNCKKRQAKTRKQYHPSVQRSYNLSKYGLTIESHAAMLKEQEGCCAICFQPAADCPRSMLYVDRDPKTGQTRSLLCSHCNSGLGMYVDSATLLSRAAAYVRLHGTKDIFEGEDLS